MWPKSFDYVRADSVEEAITLLNKREDAKLLAGGHSLLPAMKLRLAEPATLVDIGRCGLDQITDKGHGLVIGALATHATIAANTNGALSQAAAGIGDQQVRNFGTIGGNIAHADPASDPPAVLVALGAKVYVKGSGGERSLAAEDFFVDLFTTELLEDEIITSRLRQDGAPGFALRAGGRGGRSPYRERALQRGAHRRHRRDHPCRSRQRRGRRLPECGDQRRHHRAGLRGDPSGYR